jgi:hypothetical protein
MGQRGVNARLASSSIPQALFHPHYHRSTQLAAKHKEDVGFSSCISSRIMYDRDCRQAGCCHAVWHRTGASAIKPCRRTSNHHESFACTTIRLIARIYHRPAHRWVALEPRWHATNRLLAASMHEGNRFAQFCVPSAQPDGVVRSVDATMANRNMRLPNALLRVQ